MKAGVRPSLLEMLGQANTADRAREKLQDIFLLALVVALSLISYVNRLGFYMDDWGFLWRLNTTQNQSLFGLIQSIYLNDHLVKERPVQALLLGGLYWLFGLHPLGYHLFNAALFILTAVLFYLVLRKLEQSRLLALAIPLVYILLPHYSTDRFWLAAFQATISIPLYFLSLYAGSKALEGGKAKYWIWKVIGVLGLLGSCFAYEVTIPLFLLNPLLEWVRARQIFGKPEGDRYFRRSLVPIVITDLLPLALVIGYKAVTTTRLDVQSNLLSQGIGLIVGAVRVNFGTYGIGLPEVLRWIFRHRPNILIVGLTILTGLLIFLTLTRLIGDTKEKLIPQDASFWVKLTGFGLVVFGLGYGIFLSYADVWFTSASTGNRVAIAAAIGVALSFVGVIGWVSTRLPKFSSRLKIFSLLVALLCSSNILITNTLAGFWTSAYQKQQEVLSDIEAHNPALPRGSTLILDGLCLQEGGAYILNGSRDLGGALAIAYHDPDFNGGASERRPQITDQGLTYWINAKYRFFPYGDKLFIYNFQNKHTTLITDAETARRYYQDSSFFPDRDCSPGFAWGINE